MQMETVFMAALLRPAFPEREVDVPLTTFFSATARRRLKGSFG
jgi:hypothetical protein